MPEPRYAIDTSALIRLETLRVEEQKREEIWRKLVTIIDADRVFTVDHSFSELDKNNEACSARLRAYRRLPFMVRATSLATTENAGVIRMIAENYPKMAGVGGPREKADGWLIVLAHERGLIMVTEEGSGDRQKIPAACDALGIECINFFELAVRENLVG